MTNLSCLEVVHSIWEHLASHGYIVATIPQLGTSPRRFQLFIHDPPSYEAQVRDLEYVMQVMHDFPGVNVNKTAAMGMSMGGVYALLLAMRNNRIDAVVGLDPSFIGGQSSYSYKYWEAPYYDIARVKVRHCQLNLMNKRDSQVRQDESASRPLVH